MNDDRSKRNILPGYFVPEVKNQTIYTRWGFKAMPQGIAAFDLASGKAKWLYDDFGFGSGQNQNIIPISDPLISDGLMYVLLWSSHGGQKVQLACIEEATQSLVWVSTIAQAGKSSDIVGNLEKAFMFQESCQSSQRLAVALPLRCSAVQYQMGRRGP